LLRGVLVAAAGTGAAAGFYLYFLSTELTWTEFCRRLNDRFEVWNDYSRDWFDKYIVEKLAPEGNEPLLIEKEKLEIPDFVPTLILDLNKTLAFLEHDRLQGWRCIKRPHADQFLQELSRYFELVIWSDDNFPVAQDVIAKWAIPVTGVLHREFCKRRRYGYIKDISRLGRRADKMIILDHDRVAFSLQPDNGVLVREFTGDPDDHELLYLLDFLKAAGSDAGDVRSFIEKFGGGDADIGRRFSAHKQEQDKKVEQRRGIGRVFAGGGSTALPGQFPTRSPGMASMRF